MKTNRLALTLLPAAILMTSAIILLSASTAYAGPPNKCSLWPACKDDGGDPPPPDPDGSAFPQLVYRDDGIYLANEDGTSRTEIRSGGVQPHLDAPDQLGLPGTGMRVLFYDYPSLGNLNYLGLIPYSLVDGDIEVGPEQILLDQDDISPNDIIGKFTNRGLTDWSQGGDKYAYNIRQDYGDGLGWRHKIMVSPGGTSTPDFEDHTVAWDGAPDGGLGFAAWDASGDYIYLIEDFNGPTGEQWLLVLDVRTEPGTGNPPANEVARFNLTNMIGGTGFAPESQVQHASASYQTGLSVSIQTGGLIDSYSFNPGPVPARSDTSLCLMVPFADWSTRRNTRFVVIFDLPALFDDDDASNSGLNCLVATNPGSPILNFEGTDFTTGDTGILGRDQSKNRNQGVWVHDLSSGERTKIISDGAFPDWSN